MLDNFRNALLSIWSNKIRSILTVLGVVIGVTSVTTLVSLGQGLKNDVAKSIQGFGTNVITVLGGKLDTTSGSNNTNPANFITGDILTLEDVETIENIDGIKVVTPLSIVAGNVKYNEKTASPSILGTYSNFTEAMEILPIDKGRIFTSKETGNYIVLGRNATKDLFGDNNAIGKKLLIGQEEFEIIGTFGKSKTVGIFGSEFDALSVIPFDAATRLNKDQVKIMRIVAKAEDNVDVKPLKETIHNQILDNHNNEDNFTVLTQDDLLDLFSFFLNIATTMVSAIAAISLIVGGIGIMNIMLVTVTERTREIGLRKAVGATKIAILIQFLTEAIMVTFVGAFLGLLISFATGAVIAAKTDLQPAITPSLILIAAGISIGVGIIFGLWPALRAANKDPIHALRYE